MSPIMKDIQHHWNAIHPLLSIRNEKDYDLAAERLNQLIDEIGTNEQHPLYDLLEILGMVIRAYEEEHYPIPDCSGTDILQFLMDEHEMTPSDLPEIGPPDMVSNILSGRRELTVSQIRALAERFHVSTAVFI